VDAEILKGQTASDESNLTGEATPVENAWRLVLSGPSSLGRGRGGRVARRAGVLCRNIAHQRRATPERPGATGSLTGSAPTYLRRACLSFAHVFRSGGWRSARPVRLAERRTQRVLTDVAGRLWRAGALDPRRSWRHPAGARHGILFRGGRSGREIAAVTVVALDKTGTLTTANCASSE